VQNLDKKGVEALVTSLNGMNTTGCEVVVAPVALHLGKVACTTDSPSLLTRGLLLACCDRWALQEGLVMLRSDARASLCTGHARR
jgi:hypothetical protein